MKNCATCTTTLALFARTLKVVKQLPPEEFLKFKTTLIADARRDLRTSERIQ